jgi:DNA ligase-1
MDFKVIDGYVPGLKDKFMLAHPWDPNKKLSKSSEDYHLMTTLDIPPAPLGWWMSEKFDGQRALWDGKCFISRGSGSGLPRVYPYVPDFITAGLPRDFVLDGEFYLGENTFQELGFLRNVKGSPEVDAKWRKVIYQVFDLISAPGITMFTPFEERYSYLKKITFPNFVKITKQNVVKSQQDLEKYYSKVLEKGGEGLMLRAPKIGYLNRRTWLMYKYKPVQDSEAKIIGYKMGKGKYTNTLGSLQLQTPSGVTFYVSGFDDFSRKNYLTVFPKNAKVVYTYMSLTDGGVPRHPRFKGIPNDR